MKKTELENILKEVETELADFVKSNAAALRKADAEGGESEGGEDAAPGADAGSPGPDASATAPAPAAPEDASAGAEGAPAEGAPEGAPADPAAQGAGGEQVDPAQLEAEYSQMPPEMLKAHFLACKSAVEKLMGAGAGPDAGGAPGAPGGAPPAGPEGSPAGAPPAPAGPPAGPEATPPPAMKAEKPMAQPKSSVKGTGPIPGNGENDMAVHKSEMEALKVQVETLSKALTLMVERPERKAVTSFATQPAQKPLTKAEVTAKLAEKTSDPKLSKADRDLVNGFYDGRVNVEKISHLLK